MAFLHSIKLSGYMWVKSGKNPLAVEQKNYATKNLDAWPCNPLNNFKLTNCLLGTTNIVKNGDTNKMGVYCLWNNF